MKMMKKVFFSLGVIAMMSINLAMAANHTVGGANGGWDQSTDLATWAASQTFVEGDNLIFQYTVNHDVTEVSKADFGSCAASNPMQPPHTGGVTVVPLTSAGSRYFICGTGGHCLGGMKVQIDTIAASAPPPSPSVPTSPPATSPAVPAPPPPPSALPPPKSVAPTPSPKHSHSPAPKMSPPSKTAASNPIMPPASTPSPSGSSLPSPSPSSAVRFDVMGSLIACSGFSLMMFFNL